MGFTQDLELYKVIGKLSTVQAEVDRLCKELLEANYDIKMLKARIVVAKDKLASGLDLEQCIHDADEILQGDADEYVRIVSGFDFDHSKLEMNEDGA